jgi:hypothetical protein
LVPVPSTPAEIGHETFWGQNLLGTDELTPILAS